MDFPPTLTDSKLFLPTKTVLENVDEKIKEEIKNIQKYQNDRFTHRVSDRKEHMQALFLYPAMMVTDIQRELIQVVKKCQPGVQSLFDPYMGSGSTLVAGVECGLSCYGQDINPLAVLLTRVKLSTYSKTELSQSAREVIEFAKKSRVSQNIDFKGINKWFKKDVIMELSRLREGICHQKKISTRQFLWIVLAETVRLSSNDRISTYKLHCRPESETLERQIDPIEIFRRVAFDNIEQVESFRQKLSQSELLNSNKYSKPIKTAIQDSKTGVFSSDAYELFDLMVTSPPYGDNQTTIPYGQHSYLPLQWIDLFDIEPWLTNDVLQNTHYIDSKSIGGSHPKLSEKEFQRLFDLSPNLCYAVIELGKNHTNKVNKVLNFFFDLEKSLHNIALCLKSNAYAIWTIGNRNVGGKEMPNDAILMDFLIALNFDFVVEIPRTILNKKMPFKNKFAPTMKTEKILIFRKRG